MNDHNFEGLLPHDLAEDVAYAQLPYINIARDVMRLADEVGRNIIEANGALVAETVEIAEVEAPIFEAEPTRTRSEVTMSRDHTTTEAAARLGVSRPHLIKMLETGIIPFYRVGRDRRVKLVDIQDYLALREAETQARLT